MCIRDSAGVEPVIGEAGGIADMKDVARHGETPRMETDEPDFILANSALLSNSGSTPGIEAALRIAPLRRVHIPGDSVAPVASPAIAGPRRKTGPDPGGHQIAADATAAGI